MANPIAHMVAQWRCGPRVFLAAPNPSEQFTCTCIEHQDAKNTHTYIYYIYINKYIYNIYIIYIYNINYMCIYSGTSS